MLCAPRCSRGGGCSCLFCDALLSADESAVGRRRQSRRGPRGGTQSTRSAAALFLSPSFCPPPFLSLRAPDPYLGGRFCSAATARASAASPSSFLFSAPEKQQQPGAPIAVKGRRAHRQLLSLLSLSLSVSLPLSLPARPFFLAGRVCFRLVFSRPRRSPLLPTLIFVPLGARTRPFCSAAKRLSAPLSSRTLWGVPSASWRSRQQAAAAGRSRRGAALFSRLGTRVLLCVCDARLSQERNCRLNQHVLDDLCLSRERALLEWVLGAGWRRSQVAPSARAQGCARQCLGHVRLSQRRPPADRNKTDGDPDS